MTRIIIIGAGIAGLATAIGLRRLKIETLIIEQAPEVGEVGSGISLWPNALKALAALGIAGVVRRLALEEGSGGIRSWRGRLLFQLDLQELRRQLGDVTVILHRAELLSVLRDRATAADIRLGARCVGFEQNDRRVKALWSDGNSVEGDLLIGADGLHSVVRAQLFGAKKPRYAGYIAWRAITGFKHRRLLPGISLGRGSQFGQVPLKQANRVYWFATQNLPQGPNRSHASFKQNLLAVFRRWHQPIPELIEATDESVIVRTELYDRRPLKRCGHGTVTLLGDAAHPMTPDLGQGACQALEDAAVLTRCLENTNDPVAALRNYESRRIRRANSFVRASRIVGRMFQLEDDLACRARDRFLKSALYHRLQLNGLRRLAEFTP
jgi:2-polyprenyl-6-methoxyphenol hydroxylase-like FAD-dependent oxidoreductase